MNDRLLTPPPSVLIESLVDAALREDLGAAGDLTTDAIVFPNANARAELVARARGVIAGLFMAERVFARLDAGIGFEAVSADGSTVEPGDVLARVEGRARTLLTGERTALNFLGRLSGIATLTRRYRDAMGGAPAELLSTRKTTPGHRALEKYAVLAGGGGAHRYGLYDAVLVKDNHVALAGGVAEAVRRVREAVGSLVPVQVEVDTLAQLEELLPLGVDAVLLDNMDPETLRRAVALCKGKLVTEASGGITLGNIRQVAETGVDRISVGGLTHSAPSLDVALDLVA